ncbi:hypothetical protein ACM66B_002686 [Microbotryomycetes sp. NB124-2]
MASDDGPSVADLTALLYRSFVSELVKDIAIEEHKLAWRRQCRINAARPLHIQNGSNLLAPPGLKNGGGSSSRSSSPAPGHSPHKQSSNDGVSLECLNCARMIGVARYAIHLSGCMGFGGAGGRSSRGDRRAAAGGNATPTGHRPPTSGVASIGPGSRASSYASDEESIKRNGAASSRKRSGSANGRGRPKKIKTDKIGVIDLTQPLVGSHPLAKTLSAPNATQSPNLPQYASTPTSAQMMARASLPPGQPLYPAHLAADRPDSDSSSDESSISVAAAAAARRNAAGQVGQKAPRTIFNRHPLARGTGVIPDSESDSDSSNGSSS